MSIPLTVLLFFILSEYTFAASKLTKYDYFRSSPGTLIELVSRSHYGPLYGLASSPSDPNIFATVGEDKQLLLWDAKKHGQIAAIVLPELGRSCHFSPDNKFIAVGLVNGAFWYICLSSGNFISQCYMQLIKSVHDCVETIDDLNIARMEIFWQLLLMITLLIFMIAGTPTID